MTNENYLARFVEILNAHPESVRLLLQKHNVAVIGIPTLEHIKQAHSVELIQQIFNLEESIDLHNPNYSTGWIPVAVAGANAVAGILGALQGNTGNSTSNAELERMRYEAEQQRLAEEKKKQTQTYILIGVAVLVLGAVAFFFFNKNKNA